MDPEHMDYPNATREPSEDNWQATIDRLQEIVCMLLIKNQTLRMTADQGRSDTEKARRVTTSYYASTCRNGVL